MKNILLFLLSILTHNLLSAQTIIGNGTFTFPTPGSFTLTLPVGFNADVEYKIWGGGGVGGSCAPHGGDGGGGGGYSAGTTSIIAGNFPIVVGAGGTTISINGNNSSAFGVTGEGGGGGSCTQGAGGIGTTQIGGKGGVGSTRNWPSRKGGGGGGGSGPGATQGGSTNTNTGANGGLPNGGKGGDRDQNGNCGSAPGGGGGGAGGPSSVSIGGCGADGQVIVIITNYSFALPVELISFKGVLTEGKIRLEWQTASETNNKGFELQKSRDGINWNKFEFVEGNGTSLEVNSYQTIDQTPSIGINYYRLQQFDHDGAFEYSDVISIVNNKSNTDFPLLISPNPALNELHLQNIINEPQSIKIISLSGKVLKSFGLTPLEKKIIGINELPSGAHIICTKIGRNVKFQRFIKT